STDSTSGLLAGDVHDLLGSYSRFRMKLFFHRLSRSAFVRNVLTIMAGSVMAQAVGFALTPVISRLFSPTDFGLFGSFNAVAAVIGAVVTLEYTQSIMLPKDKRDAMLLFFVSCVATCVVALLC